MQEDQEQQMMQEQQAQQQYIEALQQEEMQDLPSEEEMQQIQEDAIASINNLAEGLDEKELGEIAESLCRGINADIESRQGWETNLEDYIKLAVQVKEKKSFPWPNAANVKYPLLTIACLQFHARAYKALFPGQLIVRGQVIGKDPLGLKRRRADRISHHMSYQLMHEMDAWQDDMDKLCLVLPMLGNCFKKSYFNGEVNVSELVLPQDLIVNYYARSLEAASRKTHIIPLFPNEVKEKQLSGEYLDIELDHSTYPSKPEKASDKGQGVRPPSQDEEAPHIFWECHTYLDLDDDGYKEPYIITIHEKSRKIVRVVQNWSAKNVVTNEKGDIIKIIPDQYFTNYIFIPDPQSGVYGLGFGSLLGPLNEATNTLINQLLDAGTLANLPSGFLARGIRVMHGEVPMAPGEWRHVNTPGDDLRKGIVPLPVGQPSPVLFNLLAMMVDAGRILSSVTEAMVGENPGQNQPYSTSAMVLEQGMAVYAAIFKRMHRALTRELKKLFKLNARWLPGEVYFEVIDDKNNPEILDISINDYLKDDTDVKPAADPDIITDAQRLRRAEAILATVQLGTVNPQVATRKWLEAMGETDIEELTTLPPPQPDPEIELKALELQAKIDESDQKQETERLKAMYQALHNEAKAFKTHIDAQLSQLESNYKERQLENEQRIKELELQLKLAELELKEKEINARARESKASNSS